MIHSTCTNHSDADHANQQVHLGNFCTVSRYRTLHLRHGIRLDYPTPWHYFRTGVYNIVQDINIPLIVQPQLFGSLAALSWVQVRAFY